MTTVQYISKLKTKSESVYDNIVKIFKSNQGLYKNKILKINGVLYINDFKDIFKSASEFDTIAFNKAVFDVFNIRLKPVVILENDIDSIMYLPLSNSSVNKLQFSNSSKGNAYNIIKDIDNFNIDFSTEDIKGTLEYYTKINPFNFKSTKKSAKSLILNSIVAGDKSIEDSFKQITNRLFYISEYKNLHMSIFRKSFQKDINKYIYQIKLFNNDSLDSYFVNDGIITFVHDTWYFIGNATNRTKLLYKHYTKEEQKNIKDELTGVNTENIYDDNKLKQEATDSSIDDVKIQSSNESEASEASEASNEKSNEASENESNEASENESEASENESNEEEASEEELGAFEFKAVDENENELPAFKFKASKDESNKKSEGFNFESIFDEEEDFEEDIFDALNTDDSDYAADSNDFDFDFDMEGGYPNKIKKLNKEYNFKTNDNIITDGINSYIEYIWDSMIVNNKVLTDDSNRKISEKIHVECEKIAWIIYRFLLTRINPKLDINELIKTKLNKHVEGINIKDLLDFSYYNDMNDSIEQTLINNNIHPQLETKIVCFKIGKDLLSDFGHLSHNDNVIINNYGIFVLKNNEKGTHNVSNITLQKCNFYIDNFTYVNNTINDNINIIDTIFYKDNDINYDLLKLFYDKKDMFDDDESINDAINLIIDDTQKYSGNELLADIIWKCADINKLCKLFVDLYATYIDDKRDENLIKEFNDYMNEIKKNYNTNNDIRKTDITLSYNRILNLLIETKNKNINDNTKINHELPKSYNINTTIISLLIKEVYEIYPKKKYINYDIKVDTLKDIILFLLTLLPSKYIYESTFKADRTKMKLYYKFVKSIYKRFEELYDIYIALQNNRDVKKHIELNNDMIKLIYDIKEYFNSYRIPITL